MDSVIIPTWPGIVTAALIAAFVIKYGLTARRLPRREKNAPFFTRCFPLTRGDIVPIVIIAAVAACLNYFALGDNSAPQSFHRFESVESVTLELERSADISGILFYTGLTAGEYELELSPDGESWSLQSNADETPAMGQETANLFKWRWAVLTFDTENVRYIRLTPSHSDMELGEIAVLGADSELIMLTCEAAPELIDEQDTVPDYPSYMNSMYFDEIYHGRTAYENIRSIDPYEISHPPLGKLIISIGISLFGMTPFGWRFMGATFGWLLVVLMYVFLKNMFGKTSVAVCGALLTVFDFMRYTQTRIATIDTYGVFFILLAYYFMYRFLTTPPEERFSRSMIPLGLCGLAFGLGCASKWIVVYAGAGLAILWVIHYIIMYKYAAEHPGFRFGKKLIGGILLSVVFFIAVPAAIYILSYIPYGIADGMTVGGGMLTDPKYYAIILDNQKYMLSYHSRLTSTHPYSSTWYQWVLDIRPILYYRSYLSGDRRSIITAFGNPVVWWGGIAAIVSAAAAIFRGRDGRALLITVGYAIQLIPWMIISRVVFVYHYFPCAMFLVMAEARIFDALIEENRKNLRLVIGFTALAGILFCLFFPVLTGIPASDKYMNLLRWLPGKWPI
ncbi:MAG: phospholipid carrier-dependent glycosyltransferase [Oscillospiraceae bacterium]|nr:phospholipid carrier-dependent glycosyltransferase [Oscillospiraceae bacterium]